MLTIRCAYCGAEVDAQRITKKFCSAACAQRKARGWPQKRSCRHCGREFEIRERADANRQHCSKECAKNHTAKRIKGWQSENPAAMKRYNATRLAKTPGTWREKHRTERAQTIALLGGACVVCGVTNPRWLHVDFIPTTREMRYRHPRHYAYVSKHPDLFRVLCANHHYELTLTGRIEGSAITQ